MNTDEQVLVIRRSAFGNLGLFQGVSFKIDHYLQKIWHSDEIEFIARKKAETDPDYKQLIPYVIMVHEDTILCYMRGEKSGEARLKQKYSIGIGGHINLSDVTALADGFRSTYLNAVAREIQEEVIVDSRHTDFIVGLINDDTNEVGKVHLGIIHIWFLDSPNIKIRDNEICNLEFLNIDQLQKIENRLETWSQFCLKQISEIIQTYKPQI